MATREQVSSQVTALHQEVREMRSLLERIAERLDLDDRPAERVISDPRGTFLPGTGWTGVQSPAEVEWDDETRSVKVTR